MKLQKTFTPRPGDIERSWWLVDATDMPLGRLASEVASLLRGKHKPKYSAHMDLGDHVIVINAEKVAITGAKADGKVYYRHSGYPGGLTESTFRKMQATFPERVVEKAIRGMLPQNRLGRAMRSKLKVYAGPDHPHAGQAPQPFTLISRKVETR
ncbi:MAG TPA: 50S ribosomal protein L13 [Acidimicrobiia bacterium]|nr:50S ribosomal protein L13 [Acidimicrobiia bacterium]